jgi:hypothetical protein
MPDFMASSIEAGFDGSTWVANCSSADVSTLMPFANSSTVASRRCRSHGTCANRRWWAASRAARNTITSLVGRSSPAVNSSMFAPIRAAVLGGPSGRPMSVEVRTSEAS